MGERVRAYLAVLLASVVTKKQFVTFEALVGGLLEAKRVGCSAIGKAIRGSAYAKHKIKRVDRFLSNKRIPVDKISASLISQLCGSRRRVLVAVDWTKMYGFQVLTAAIITEHRAIPVVWRVIDKDEIRMAEIARLWQERASSQGDPPPKVPTPC